MTRVAIRLHHRIAIALAATFAAPSAADVLPRVESVPCVPGGIAAIPVARTPGEPWPSRIAVRIGDLQSTAPLVWVGAGADPRARVHLVIKAERGAARIEEIIRARVVGVAAAGGKSPAVGAAFPLPKN